MQAEEGLKSGAVPVVVATASLELGIDVGHVDLVCHLGSPRALATLLQRVGRSGHWLGAVPKGILFPLTRDDLVQCAAAVRAIRAGELDRIEIPQNPLDILAQQIVAAVASQEMAENEVWDLVHRAYPFRNLDRDDFEAVLEMLSEGVATSRGRRSAHLHRDRVHHKLRPRRGARLAAITSGGAIPDTADYDVIEEPAGTFVGKVNEDFAVESMGGDIFLLGNRSWRIRRVEMGKVRVEDAQGAPPTIPFWLGEAPARTAELSAAVAELREEVAVRRHDNLARGRSCLAHAAGQCGLDQAGAEQIVAYVAETHAALGAVPTQQTIIAERFFDEGGGMQLVVHAPFGGRINRAWGLALRKRFCRTFDFELQAAATDDGIVLSLGEQHSFPLENVFQYGASGNARSRSDPSRARRTDVRHALALERDARAGAAAAHRRQARAHAHPAHARRGSAGGGLPGAARVRRQPSRRTDRATGSSAGQRNHRQLPARGDGHSTALRALIESIERGEVRTLAVDTAAPSPMSHEILNANPYAFLDDAPLEERRARAVSLRRLDPDLAGGIGALDQAAIDEVAPASVAGRTRCG